MNDYENEMNYEDRILETTYTAEDSETEFSLRPRTLDEYIGQEKAKEILKIYIRQGWAKLPSPRLLRQSLA